VSVEIEEHDEGLAKQLTAALITVGKKKLPIVMTKRDV
jgi:hypothetical protein